MSKYCILPGQEPVRLDSLDGHIIIIGEELRDVPEQFVLKARAAGCLTEEELHNLKQRLLGSSDRAHDVPPEGSGNKTVPPAGSQGIAPGAPQINLLMDADDDGFAPPPSRPAPPEAPGERMELIKAAVIELMNAGNASDFTGNGTPKVEALKDRLGFEVTAAERDTAYEAAKG